MDGAVIGALIRPGWRMGLAEQVLGGAFCYQICSVVMIWVCVRVATLHESVLK